ncbi:MAG: hypothetical protein HQL52_16245 [Magnetococcales bacterium]|nr:hypothetical protein [Magnetococcales bacterium]
MKRGNAQMLIDLDEQLFHLRGRKLIPLEKISKIKRHKWLITDFQGAIPRVMVAQAGRNDAGPVLEKQLREIGELDSPGEILIHAANERDKHTWECFFTAVNQSTFGDYQFSANEDPDHHLLFSFPSLLAKAREQIKPKRPAAILIHHDRHVELLVADNKRLYESTRVSVSNPEDRDRFPDLIQTVLLAAEQSCEIKIREIHFHYWLSPDPQEFGWVKTLAEVMQITSHTARSELLKLNKERRHSTLLPLLSALNIGDAVSKKKDRAFFFFHRIEPWLALPMVAAVLLLGFFTLQWDREVNALQEEIFVLRQRINDGLAKETKGELHPDYTDTQALVETLDQARQQPIPDLILRQIYQSAAPRVAFDRVKLDYGEEGVGLHLNGRVDKRFGNDVETFNGFVANMRRKGYSVVESTLQTDIHYLLFNLKLDRALHESQS